MGVVGLAMIRKEIDSALLPLTTAYVKWASDWQSGANPLPAQRAIQPVYEVCVARILALIGRGSNEEQYK
jgi:hypothetical protein